MFKTLFMLLLAAAPIKLGKSVDHGMKVLEEEQRDGYRCQMVEYNVSAEERVKAFLLIPDGASESRRCPGLVLLHDHGARFDIGKEKLVRPMKSAPDYIKKSSEQWVEDGFDGVYFGDRLASEGYVVIVSDQLYWGDRRTALCDEWSRIRFGGKEGDISKLKTPVYEGQRAVYDSLQRRGVVWAEQTLNEDAAAARLLKSLKYVDGSNIGCFGWSMGAHRSWLLAAFCKDVKTGVALCWMTLKETQAVPYKASDYSMLIPALHDHYDYPDIALWLRPKRFFFLCGEQDKLFPVWSVKTAYARMKEDYTAVNARENLKAEFFDGPHHCGLAEQRRIIDYLDGELRHQKD